MLRVTSTLLEAECRRTFYLRGTMRWRKFFQLCFPRLSTKTVSLHRIKALLFLLKWRLLEWQKGSGLGLRIIYHDQPELIREHATHTQGPWPLDDPLAACSTLTEGTHTPDYTRVFFLVIWSWQTLELLHLFSCSLCLQQRLESPEVDLQFLSRNCRRKVGLGAWLSHTRPTGGLQQLSV